MSTQLNVEGQPRSDSRDPQSHPRAQVERGLAARRGLWVGAAAEYAVRRGES